MTMVSKRGTENRIRQGGMLNLGNTGYMEVILQTLYHCTEFRESILSLDLGNIIPRDNASVFEMIIEFQIIFQEWKRVENILPKAEDPDGQVKHDVLRLVYSHINPYIGPLGHVDPTEFVSTVRKCMSLRFPIDQPNDAHNFYQVFIRKLKYFFEMERVPKEAKLAFERVFEIPRTTIKRCTACDAVLSKDPLAGRGGIAPYCFDCPVSPAQNPQVEQYNHLTPLILQALGEGDGSFVNVNLHHVTCECSPDRPASASISRRPIYSRLPTLLTVRFKRWPVTNRNAYFEFDEFLDLSDLLLLDEAEKEFCSLQYRLLSVVVHHGNCNGYGRYFSFVRCNDGTRWGRFWGADVEPVDWDTVKRESFGKLVDDSRESPSKATNIGYMLFYERVSSD